jgi:hypothetical protein
MAARQCKGIMAILSKKESIFCVNHRIEMYVTQGLRKRGMWDYFVPGRSLRGCHVERDRGAGAIVPLMAAPA